MSLVTKDKLTGYKDSYLYQTMRSFHESEEEPRFVLTHYVPKQKTKVEAQRAVEKMANNSETNTNKKSQVPTSNRSNKPTTGPADNWDPNAWVPSTSAPTDKVSKPAVTSQNTNRTNKLPTTSHTETLPIPNTTSPQKTKQHVMKSNVLEPKTEVARYRPGTEPAKQKRPVSQNTSNAAEGSSAASINATKPANKVRAESNHNNQQTQPKVQAQNSVPKSPVQKPTRNSDQVVAKKQQQPDDFINLQQVFETAEWLRAANQLKVELNAHVNQMLVKAINLIDLSDRSETYIPLDKRTLNLLYSVVIGKNKDIILIFGDGTTINMAPQSWLSKNVNANVLLNNHYNYVYHDLNLTKLLQGLKPLCASEVNTPQYMQMWLKYIPFVPAKED